ncbi:hypothetical protein Ancab_025602 [Ancistrocladus abbreviatus]
MFSIKSRSQHFRNYFKPPYSSQLLIHSSRIPSSRNWASPWFSSSPQKLISTSTQFDYNINSERKNSNRNENLNGKNKRALDILFKEAVGLIPTGENSECESGNNVHGESAWLKKRLRELEIEIRELTLKGKSEMTDRKSRVKSGDRENEMKEWKLEDDPSKGKSKSLYAVFTQKNLREGKLIREREELVVKEFSSDMIGFLRHLYDEGYFKDANFLPRNRFDVSSFENGYARDFLKFAAERFGNDNQEIAKWISGSDLKTVALFGCPSLSRRTVFAAKRLRTFFQIPENSVCSKCILRKSCNFENQSVWKGNTQNLNLQLVMRLLVVYAMEAVSPQLVLSDEVKACVTRLLKDLIKLSKTVHEMPVAAMTTAN